MFYCLWKCRNLMLRIAEVICTVMPKSLAFDRSSTRAVEVTRTVLLRIKQAKSVDRETRGKGILLCHSFFPAYLVIENKKSPSKKAESLGWQSFYFDGLFGGRETPFSWGAGVFRSVCYTLEKSKASLLESLSEEAGLCNQGRSCL